jgi:prepilin-type N-terminal cleavage/methylation domain-containing protein/prepilin-type processing-associated H-X9-DG protein
MNKAFTLIEILIVIAILGVLVALMMSAFHMVRSSSNSTKCLSNVRQMQAGNMMYATENRGRFAPVFFAQPTKNDAVEGTQWYRNPAFIDYVTGGPVDKNYKTSIKSMACPLLVRIIASFNNEDNLLMLSYGYNTNDKDSWTARNKPVGPRTTDRNVGERIMFIDAIGWTLCNTASIKTYYRTADDLSSDIKRTVELQAGPALRHARKANMAFGDGRAAKYGFETRFGPGKKEFNDADNGMWSK